MQYASSQVLLCPARVSVMTWTNCNVYLSVDVLMLHAADAAPVVPRSECDLSGFNTCENSGGGEDSWGEVMTGGVRFGH